MRKTSEKNNGGHLRYGGLGQFSPNFLLSFLSSGA